MRSSHSPKFSILFSNHQRDFKVFDKSFKLYLLRIDINRKFNLQIKEQALSKISISIIPFEKHDYEIAMYSYLTSSTCSIEQLFV